MNTENAQRHFYEHLCMHPRAHEAARRACAKLQAKDPAAQADLRKLALRAKSDPQARNALKAIAVTCKYESPDGIISGALPNVVQAGGKIIRLALSPLSWAAGTAGKVAHWTGAQLQSLAHAI